MACIVFCCVFSASKQAESESFFKTGITVSFFAGAQRDVYGRYVKIIFYFNMLFFRCFKSQSTAFSGTGLKERGGPERWASRYACVMGLLMPRTDGELMGQGERLRADGENG